MRCDKCGVDGARTVQRDWLGIMWGDVADNVVSFAVLCPQHEREYWETHTQRVRVLFDSLGWLRWRF